MELEDEAKSLANLTKVQHSLQNFELHQCEVGWFHSYHSIITNSIEIFTIDMF